MDSKIKYQAVVLAILALLCVASVVAALNPRQTAELINQLAGREVFAAGGVSENDAQTPPVENGFVQDVLDEDGRIVGSDLSAFQRDETFFDPKKARYEALLEKRSRHTLSLMATSVEKDLRVQVVDELGRRVTGQRFLVTLKDSAGRVVTENGALSPQESGQESAGGYQDLDQDGIIYIGGLKAGDYTLSLQPVEAYDIAAGALPVNVKDKLEYRVIDDISALIRTEDEIDVAKEDTKENEAGKDVDGDEETKLRKSDGNMRAGIDVSKWNGEIDWGRVRAAGVDFAIIRCGYRGSASGVLVEDPYFWKNLQGAKANGVSVGVYFFTQAVTEVEAVEEASMVLSLCGDYDLDYPVFIDTEGAGGNGRADGLSEPERTAVCRAFCETIRSAGLDAGVYASRSWWYHNISADTLSPYVTWLAEYRSKPIYTGKYHLWQYTSSGAVDGIDGRVDLNISYLGY